MTGWEPIVTRGASANCKSNMPPVEGYEGWGNNSVLLKGAGDRGVSDAAHKLSMACSAASGCELGKARDIWFPRTRT